MKITLISLVTSLCLLHFDAHAFLNEITKKQLEVVQKGELVLKTKSLKNYTWPEVYLYFKITASPLESVSVFYALEHQKNYIPNLVKSKVTKQLSPTEVYTDYEMKMPWPLSNSKYLHGSTLSYDKDKGYKVTWYKVQSSVTDKVDGDATFVRFDDYTLVRYRALVQPKSFFANFVKSRMLKDVKASMIAVRNEVERIKKEDRKKLGEFVSFIDKSLSGEFYYKK